MQHKPSPEKIPQVKTWDKKLEVVPENDRSVRYVCFAGFLGSFQFQFHFHLKKNLQKWEVFNHEGISTNLIVVQHRSWISTQLKL